MRHAGDDPVAGAVQALPGAVARAARAVAMVALPTADGAATIAVAQKARPLIAAVWTSAEARALRADFEFRRRGSLGGRGFGGFFLRRGLRVIGAATAAGAEQERQNTDQDAQLSHGPLLITADRSSRAASSGSLAARIARMTATPGTGRSVSSGRVRRFTPPRARTGIDAARAVAA